MWDETKLQAHIDNAIEESLTLEYKAADSLALTDGKRREITKDISAMANSAGGLIVYGLREFKDISRQHLAEHVDPIDRIQFSKEWLEQIINNIRPRINNLIIHSISLSSAENHVAYVVEIPQSTTAHQATDHRYYKRFNFLSQPMEDYEIRDILNRAAAPDMSVEFSYTRNSIESNEHYYTLEIKLKNLGRRIIHHFQLRFTFPQLDGNVRHTNQLENVDLWASSRDELVFVYRSKKVCFPEEEIDIGRELAIQYMINSQIYANSQIAWNRGPLVRWTLYADNMIPKTDSMPFEKLQCF